MSLALRSSPLAMSPTFSRPPREAPNADYPSRHRLQISFESGSLGLIRMSLQARSSFYLCPAHNLCMPRGTLVRVFHDLRRGAPGRMEEPRKAQHRLVPSIRRWSALGRSHTECAALRRWGRAPRTAWMEQEARRWPTSSTSPVSRPLRPTMLLTKTSSKPSRPDVRLTRMLNSHEREAQRVSPRPRLHAHPGGRGWSWRGLSWRAPYSSAEPPAVTRSHRPSWRFRRRARYPWECRDCKALRQAR